MAGSRAAGTPVSKHHEFGSGERFVARRYIAEFNRKFEAVAKGKGTAFQTWAECMGQEVKRSS